MASNKLTPNQKRARGIQLEDLPSELPLSLRRRAHEVLTRRNSLGQNRVHLASTHRDVPDNIRGKWLVDEGFAYPNLPVTVRQWTYRYLVQQAVAAQ